MISKTSQLGFLLQRKKCIFFLYNNSVMFDPIIQFSSIITYVYRELTPLAYTLQKRKGNFAYIKIIRSKLNKHGGDNGNKN